MKAYILSVATTALICTILTSLPGADATAGKWVKVAAGLVVLFAIVRPMSNIQLNTGNGWIGSLREEAQTIVASGTSQTNYALGQRIKEQAEAYILDKALSLGVSLEVEVVISEDMLPVPIGVTLRGDISPYAKSQLTNMIESDLGITGGLQEWK